LLDILGLTNYRPNEEGINIKLFKDSFATTGRLDAEYYQPKNEQIMNIIMSKPHVRLFEIFDVKKSIEPGSDAYSNDDTGIPFLRVSDYSKFGVAKPQKYLHSAFVNENNDKLNELKPKKNTILFSKDGSIGEAFCLDEDANFITSGAILHLIIRKPNEYPLDYLTLVLNSKLIKMQAERDAGGSVILHWRTDEIKNVVIPLVSWDIQMQIAVMIKESFKLKKQSNHLLEVAKRAVEIAIEQDENAGLAYIEANS
jgi:hypothetical protein